ERYVPPIPAVVPFILLLLSIAVLPLIPATSHWWEHNSNRFLVAAFLGAITLIYYGVLHPGGLVNHFTHQTNSAPGLETVFAVFSNAIFGEFIAFIVLLFSLYVISGGINLRGDLPAHPGVNVVFLALGTLLASFIGTTGSAMVFIRPLLSTNRERKYRVHTVVFFIFLVCNCGGLLLPVGDPPLFLGYLRGVPFTWTLQLWPYWLGVNISLLLIYYVWDRILYAREDIRSILRDEAHVEPLKLTGKINIPLIIGVVCCVAFIVPGKPFPLLGFETPRFMSEMVMLLLVITSLLITKIEVRLHNRFDFHAILEVAALFSGIFVCMQVPIELLQIKGASLGLTDPFHFFWFTGILSSFLDNAPTYVVFFETAAALPHDTGTFLSLGGARYIAEQYLVPISLGAVFMGANTYIGNGPNFMVKSIAESSGIKMPSFFGYMGYSLLVLIPVFIIVTYFL
ncbi:MAG: sodium:proton antiporter, partial [Acidobacteriota bacterium]